MTSASRSGYGAPFSRSGQPGEYTDAERLRSLMQAAGIESYRALSRQAEVSEWQVRQLRQGQVQQMRLDPLIRLSQALQISLPELLQTFAPELDLQPGGLATAGAGKAAAEIKQEYERLQAQMDDQACRLKDEFQKSSLTTLESWLLQWPTAAYAAQQNPEIPASRLLPLVRPVEQLLAVWGVEAIATVGNVIPYDPQVHQLMDGSAQPGEPVRVRYAGYRHQGKLLHRAKVSPVST